METVAQAVTAGKPQARTRLGLLLRRLSLRGLVVAVGLLPPAAVWVLTEGSAKGWIVVAAIGGFVGVLGLCLLRGRGVRRGD